MAFGWVVNRHQFLHHRSGHLGVSTAGAHSVAPLMLATISYYIYLYLWLSLWVRWQSHAGNSKTLRFEKIWTDQRISLSASGPMPHDWFHLSAFHSLSTARLDELAMARDPSRGTSGNHFLVNSSSYADIHNGYTPLVIKYPLPRCIR